MLLESPVYKQQAKQAVRGAPAPEQIKRFLQLVDQRNGRVLRAQLAQHMSVPLFRVEGLVQNYRRLFNLDGYDVLSYDQASETITLNIRLLKNQFELPE